MRRWLWMGVGCLCPPIRNDIMTLRHLFSQIQGPLFKNFAAPELSNETPAGSPPWYATPDASTPGEKFFTPSLEEETRRFSIPIDASGPGEATSGTAATSGATTDVTEAADGQHNSTAAAEEARTPSSFHSEGLSSPDAVPALELHDVSDDHADLQTDVLSGKEEEEDHNGNSGIPHDRGDESKTRGEGRETEGDEATRRPVSIGQDDEFILLPAFNPDFDEIFTSLTK